MGTRGEVTIQNIRDRLRLRWTWCGKQKALTIGGDSPAARSLAQAIASKIKLDILTGNYDESLKKYQIKPERSLTALEILDFYFRKLDKVSPKHIAVRRHVERWGDRSGDSVSIEDGQSFLDDLKLKPSTYSAYLFILKAAWMRSKIENNPWAKIKAPLIKLGNADPFTQDEVNLILGAFAESYYLPYVKGLFATGCRPGEVSALTWGDVRGNDLMISKSWDDRKLRINPTKTGRDRIIPIGPGLLALLSDLRTDEVNESDLIFPAKQGGPISAKSFLKRHWQPALKLAGIRYRSTYRTRHTVWSHAIDQGMSVIDAADLAGNRPETMTRHYLGKVKRPSMPELL